MPAVQGNDVETQVIAHRGASGVAPENTMAAFWRAVDMGAHMIELDVQLTLDGAVVVLHDDTVDRTTDGRGAVGRLTAREIRALDAGSWFDAAYAGEPVPLLAEVLERIELPCNVELKSGGGPALTARTLEIVRDADALGRVVFSSFDREAVVRLHAAEPDATLAVLSGNGTIGQALTEARRVNATALHVRKTRRWLRWLRDTPGIGLDIRVWTVNSLDEWVPFEAAGASGVFTDHPDRFLQISPA
jgi:glycerophosphoryl diester phosphodiesterase